jgi:hypothetical protein
VRPDQPQESALGGREWDEIRSFQGKSIRHASKSTCQQGCPDAKSVVIRAHRP